MVLNDSSFQSLYHPSERFQSRRIDNKSEETSSLKDRAFERRTEARMYNTVSRCTCFLHSFPRRVTKLQPQWQPTFHPLHANFSSFEDGKYGVSIRHLQEVGSHLGRKRRNEVAARGWILIKNRYITPIRGSATADYAASSLIRERLFEPRLGWQRAQLSASMSRH